MKLFEISKYLDPGNIEISKIHFKIQKNPLVQAIILDFPEFRQNSAEISTKNNSFSLNFSNILQQSENFAKDCRKSKKWVWSGAKVCHSSRSRKMLQNEYLVAKIGFDTAENEPSKVDISIFRALRNLKLKFDISNLLFTTQNIFF